WRLGRSDRQAHGVALSVRQTHVRLAEAEDSAGAGIRHRRLDRAAPKPDLLRRAVAGRTRIVLDWHQIVRRPDLRGPRRDRIRSPRAGKTHAADETARDPDIAACPQSTDQRTSALGSADARGSSAIY